MPSFLYFLVEFVIASAFASYLRRALDRKGVRFARHQQHSSIQISQTSTRRLVSYIPSSPSPSPTLAGVPLGLLQVPFRSTYSPLTAQLGKHQRTPQHGHNGHHNGRPHPQLVPAKPRKLRTHSVLLEMVPLGTFPSSSFTTTTPLTHPSSPPSSGSSRGTAWARRR